jgi:hypothetical protein
MVVLARVRGRNILGNDWRNNLQPAMTLKTEIIICASIWLFIMFVVAVPVLIHPMTWL